MPRIHLLEYAKDDEYSFKVGPGVRAEVVDGGIADLVMSYAENVIGTDHGNGIDVEFVTPLPNGNLKVEITQTDWDAELKTDVKFGFTVEVFPRFVSDIGDGEGEVFRLLEVTESQIVLQNLAKDERAIAKHPYLSADIAFINVSRGKNRTYTIVFNGGKTHSWDFGDRGWTLVDNNTSKLQQAINAFCKRNRIAYEVAGENVPHSAKVLFNHNLKCWQADLYFGKRNAEHQVFLGDCGLEAAIAEAKRWNPSFGDAVEGVAATGIQIWELKDVS